MAPKLNDSSPVIVEGCRTPFLRSGTDFKDTLTYDLARMALKGLIDKAGLSPSEIEHVIFGCVLSEPRTSNVPILLKRALRQKLFELRRLKTPIDWFKWGLGLRPGYLLPEIPEIAEFSNGLTMGRSSDRLSARWGVSREEQDRYALRSHQLASEAARKK